MTDTRPYLFLDFDRTLFDTEQLYDWLGQDVSAMISALTSGKISPPDFSSMLYPGTIDFLNKISETHTPVILTYATDDQFQLMKLKGSGVLPCVSDYIITAGNKGEEAKKYIEQHDAKQMIHFFVDDTVEKIDEMRIWNENVSCFLIRHDDDLVDVKHMQNASVVGSFDELFAILTSAR